MALEISTDKPQSCTKSPPSVAAGIDKKHSKHSAELSTKVAENEGTVPDDVYPTGSKLGIIIFALCIAVFCVALDSTVVATAIPRITDDFHALQDIGWYGSAYLLTTAAFQLPYGKLYASLNIKTVFLAALVIFEVGSVVCGTSPNSSALIVGVSSYIETRKFNSFLTDVGSESNGRIGSCGPVYWCLDNYRTFLSYP